MTATQALAAFIEAARIMAAANDNASPPDLAEAVARALAEQISGDAGGSGRGTS